MTEVQEGQAPGQGIEPDSILSLYEIVFTKFNQEGDGIWGRFNIVLALNLAIFAGVALICFADRRPIHWRLLAGSLSVGGLLTSIWSLYVLHRLWASHRRWRERLEEIQKNFPSGWVTPVGPSRSTWIGRFGLTQPYLVLFAIAWALLLAVLWKYPEAADVDPKRPVATSAETTGLYGTKMLRTAVPRQEAEQRIEPTPHYGAAYPERWARWKVPPTGQASLTTTYTELRSAAKDRDDIEGPC